MTTRSGAHTARPEISERRSDRSCDRRTTRCCFAIASRPLRSTSYSARSPRHRERTRTKRRAQGGSRTDLARVRRSARGEVRRQDRHGRPARRAARRAGVDVDRSGVRRRSCGRSARPHGGRRRGAVALAAKHGTLAEIRVEYGAPIGFMLATPVPYGDAYAELSTVRVADRRRQVRRHPLAQAHLRGGAGAAVLAPRSTI